MFRFVLRYGVANLFFVKSLQTCEVQSELFVSLSELLETKTEINELSKLSTSGLKTSTFSRFKAGTL